MKQTFITMVGFLAAIILAAFILGCGMALYATYGALYAVWHTIELLFKALVFPFGHMVLGPCRY